MEAKSIEPKAENRDGNAKNPREGADATARALGVSPRAVCSALNRLIVASRGEIIALDAALSMVGSAERRARLREQINRRVIFQRDLTAAVVALGGVPAKNASRAARLAATARRVRGLLIGSHEGDAYAVCARATERVAAVYSKALRMALPADVRFGVEHQGAEIECDRSELRRLRWGANLDHLPDQGATTKSERPEGRSRGELDDERALEAWGEDGGAGGGRPTVKNAPRRLAGAIH